LVYIRINIDFSRFVHRAGALFCIGEYPIREFFPFLGKGTGDFISYKRRLDKLWNTPVENENISQPDRLSGKAFQPEVVVCYYEG